MKVVLTLKVPNGFKKGDCDNCPLSFASPTLILCDTIKYNFETKCVLKVTDKQNCPLQIEKGDFTKVTLTLDVPDDFERGDCDNCPLLFMRPFSTLGHTNECILEVTNILDCPLWIGDIDEEDRYLRLY